MWERSSNFRAAAAQPAPACGASAVQIRAQASAISPCPAQSRAMLWMGRALYTQPEHDRPIDGSWRCGNFVWASGVQRRCRANGVRGRRRHCTTRRGTRGPRRSTDPVAGGFAPCMPRPSPPTRDYGRVPSRHLGLLHELAQTHARCAS